jgi:DDE superfamily endonuclease/Helix-turn-helix of DDE superfamily endonuclease
MDLNRIKALPESRVRALTGLTPPALAELLFVILPELVGRRHHAKVARPDRKRAVGGGDKRGLEPVQEVLMVLIYLRHNVAHEVVGQMFGVSADTSGNLFHEIVPLLRELCPANRYDAEKRWKKGEPSWTPDGLDRILVDTFETSVPRPSKEPQQKRLYSGKKKRHTLKTQVVTDATGEVLAIDAGHRGPAADKRILEQSDVGEQFPEAVHQGDLGYQGAAGVELPNKKPKGGTLTPEQKQENRQKAKVRVHVEHGIRRIKAFKIVRENYRLATGLFPMVASAVVGLVQMVRIIQ